MQTLAPLSRYIVCARVRHRPIFELVLTRIHSTDASSVFALEDDYSFGIPQLSVLWEWFVNRCSTLKADFRYTSDTVYDSFPWPSLKTLELWRRGQSSCELCSKLKKNIRFRCESSIEPWNIRDITSDHCPEQAR